MIYKGNVQKMGDSVDADGMIAGRYLSILNPAELAKHIFEETDPDFAKRVKPGDMIVAGKNFGCGSGREQAPFGLKALGISCIVATSFSRTFYRMAIDLETADGGQPRGGCSSQSRAERSKSNTETGESQA